MSLIKNHKVKYISGKHTKDSEVDLTSLKTGNSHDHEKNSDFFSPLICKIFFHFIQHISMAKIRRLNTKIANSS